MLNHNDITAYSKGSKLFHWLVAIIVIGMLAASFFLDDLPKAYQGSSWLVHKSLGLTVLFLMIVRFVWIKYCGKPALPAAVPAWEKVLSCIVQYSFYVFLIAMPLCGWIMSMADNRIPSYFGLFNLPLPGIKPNEALGSLMFQAHKAIAFILIALIVLHVAGAIKHHFIEKDDVLRRMLP